MPSTDAAVRTRDASGPSALTRLHTTSRRLGGTSCSAATGVGARRRPTVQAARLDPVPDELRRVERIPGRSPPQRGRDAVGLRRRRRPAATETRSANSSSSNPASCDPDAGLVRDRPARGATPRTRARPRFAATGNEEHRYVGERVRDVTQHQERGRLRPLEVIEDQYERPRRGDAAEEIGRGLEREVSLGRVVGDRRRRRGLDPRREQRADRRELAAEARDVLATSRATRARRTRPAHCGTVGAALRSRRTGRRPRSRRPTMRALRERGPTVLVLPIPDSPRSPRRAVRSRASANSLGQRLQSFGPTNASCANARQRNRDDVDRRAKSDGSRRMFDAVPVGGDPPLDTHNLGRGSVPNSSMSSVR